jgi:metal-responsive CopG/Arc/MetJ family transcriptional regulator
MTMQMLIRIDEQKRKALDRLSKSEGKTTSEVVRELIDTFITQHDASGYIDGLWSRIGQALKRKGYSESDIPKLIKESRMAAR